MRKTTTVERAAGTRVVVGGRELVSFGGCDSLGLARHAAVVAAAREALDRFGVGATASRTTTGTLEVHVRLERALAASFGTRDAVLLPAGWLAPQALAAALAPRCDAVLLDDLAHPAVADAARLAGLPVTRFAHFDAADAGRKSRGLRRVLVMTDGTDPARGRIAPLRALARVAGRSGGHLLVDDAHGVGVLGARGHGAVDAARAAAPHVHVAGSLSKAFGAQGGFVVGPRALCGAIRTRAAVYAGATPVAAPVAAAALEAVRLARDGTLRRRLFANAGRLRRHFARLGIAPPPDRVPWFSIDDRPARDLARLSRRLRGSGFLVPHLRYFGGPPGGNLKIAVSAAHTAEEIDALADALARERSGGRPA